MKRLLANLIRALISLNPLRRHQNRFDTMPTELYEEVRKWHDRRHL
jgi:hypothetical protein